MDNNINTANKIDKEFLEKAIKFLLSFIKDDKIILDIYKSQDDFIMEHIYDRHEMDFTDSIAKINIFINNCINELAKEREGKLLEDINYFEYDGNNDTDTEVY